MKPKWPTLENGVVDWITVFQHPQSGLIANINRADSSEKLQACMHVIAESLFVREEDADVREKFLAAIEELFNQSDNSLLAEKTKMKMLMTKIMYDRETRARRHAELKAANKIPQDQRLDGDDPLHVFEKSD